MSALVTDPAWSDAVLFVALIPVAMLVVLALQTLALHLAERAGKRGQ